MSSAATPPIGLVFNEENIPAELKALPRWGVWRAVWNDKRGKYDKIPYNPVTGHGISTKTPEAWASFDTALHELRVRRGQYTGLGLVLTGLRDVLGIDLDNCLDPNGAPAPWACEVLAHFDTYTERSPSGNGLRLLAYGQSASDFVNHEVGVELYNGHTPRFLTITGDHLPGTSHQLLDSNSTPSGVAWLTDTYRRKPNSQSEAQILTLTLPEMLPEVLLPDPLALGASEALMRFLDDGAPDGDQSLALHTAGVALYQLGMTDAQVFSTLAQSDAAMQICLAHRNQDHDRALQYLWLEHCQKARHKAHTPESVLADFDDCSDKTAPPKSVEPKRVRFQLQDFETFTAPRRGAWHIKKILPQGALGVIYGESGSGKSFFTLDLVAAVSRGAPWRGHRVTPGRVVYVCAEGQEDFRKRVRAYAEHHGINAQPNGGMQMHFIDEAPNLMEATDLRALLKQIMACPGGPPAIVVVDTLAQAMAGGNENSGEDVGTVLGHCQSIHRATGALVMLVHHSGKDTSRGARGWSGLRGAADFEMEITRVEGASSDRVAELTKLKGGEDGLRFGFHLMPVVVGVDEDGEQLTSLVVNAAEARKARGVITGVIQLAVVRCLENIIESTGEGPTSNALAANVLAFLPPSDSDRDKRPEHISRAIDALLGHGTIILESSGRLSLP